MSNSLQRYGLQPARLLSWDSPGKNTGVNCHVLLQGSSQLRDQTCVSYVSCTGRFFTISATWETLCLLPASIKPQRTSLLADKEGRLSVPLQFLKKYCRYKLYCIYLFIWQQGMHNLSFPDQGLNLCPLQWKHSFNHGTTRESPFYSS